MGSEASYSVAVPLESPFLWFCWGCHCLWITFGTAQPLLLPQQVGHAMFSLFLKLWIAPKVQMPWLGGGYCTLCIVSEER